jgi:hypothetical protein
MLRISLSRIVIGIELYSFLGSQCDVDGVFFERADLQHRESDYIPVCVDFFHYLVIGSFPKIALLSLEHHL